MTTITLNLPDDVAEKARRMTPEALAELIRKADPPALPEGFDPRLLGKVNPELYGSGKTLGDIVSPLDEKWDAES